MNADPIIALVCAVTVRNSLESSSSRDISIFAGDTRRRLPRKLTDSLLPPKTDVVEISHFICNIDALARGECRRRRHRRDVVLPFQIPTAVDPKLFPRDSRERW